MNISPNNFFQDLHGLKYFVYGYESAKNLYDVYVSKLEGTVTYMRNSKECEKNEYHYAIIKNFNLSI